MPCIAKVAVNDATIHFDKLYSYLVPPDFSESLWPGSIVLVPFGRGNHPRMAVVLEVGTEEAPDPRLKSLLAAAPEKARLTPDLLELVHFLKDRYFCTWYEAVKAVIPYGAQYQPGMENGKPVLKSRLTRTLETVYTLVGGLPEKPKPGARQIQAVEALRAGPCTKSALEAQGISSSTLNGLCQKGILKTEQRDKSLDLFADIPFDPQPLELSPEQQTAYDQLEQDLLSGQTRAALLHGVTGSGKTAVFLKLIEKTLAQGRRALVLVPEISLTPQMTRRLKSMFGSRLAVQHSALNNTERLLQWRMIQNGDADIVIGTRSAIYHAAISSRMRLVTLTHRYGGRPLPTVDFIDMRAELAAGNPREVSQRMVQELAANLQRGEQSILLLNRRGYQTVGMCGTCGHVLKCPNCSVPLVYHKAQHALLCHYCGHRVSPVPGLCPECGGKIVYSGFGTQKVEEELAELLPGARILRMDQDSTMQKNAHEKMLARFAKQEYDILLGTQMVAKGLDFGNVTLVGVLGIDSLLFGQGFRSYENVFSLITQVVGRGGRAELPGRALIQTAVPDHPVLQLAAAQDYPAFYQQEIMFRKFSLYPPFCSFCVVGFSGAQEMEVFQAARRFAAILGQQFAAHPGQPLRVLGPTPMNIAMISGKYRYKLTLKCRNDAGFRTLMHAALDAYAAEKLPAKAGIALDFNSDGD